MGRKLLERLGCGPREGFGSLTRGTREAVRCTRERTLERCVVLTGRAGRVDARENWAGAKLGCWCGPGARKEKREGLGWFLGWAGLLKGLGFLSLFYFFLLSYFKPTQTKTICIQIQI